MTVNLLILAGTIEASELAQAVATKGYRACLSYAGRVERPKAQPIEKRIGGFGGVQGLFAYLKAEQITHVIDATHPFAAQMSENAVLACAKARVPLLALTRPPWRPEAADQWQSVPDIPAAAAALPAQKQNIMLAIGRMHLDLFAAKRSITICCGLWTRRRRLWCCQTARSLYLVDHLVRNRILL